MRVAVVIGEVVVSTGPHATRSTSDGEEGSLTRGRRSIPFSQQRYERAILPHLIFSSSYHTSLFMVLFLELGSYRGRSFLVGFACVPE